jgi:RNA polymerase sigma factor (sigma-70 family)
MGMTTNEGQELMIELIKLKKIAKETKRKHDILTYEKHFALCMSKFEYLVKMKTSKYKTFANYEDLNQEGREAMIKAMNTFDPKKGNWFAWAHDYIGTRIFRSANLHTAIRYPLKFARETPPHKETFMPELIEEHMCPDTDLERSQMTTAVHNALSVLTKQQKEIVSLAFGFNGGNPLTVNKICRKIRMNRLDCFAILEEALSLMKENIKL